MTLKLDPLGRNEEIQYYRLVAYLMSFSSIPPSTPSLQGPKEFGNYELKLAYKMEKLNTNISGFLTFGIFSDFFGILWKLLESIGTPWNPLEYFRILWNP